MNVAGLILAAGRSSRMGKDKALLRYRGRHFLSHLIYLALPRVTELVAVLGHNAERIAASLPDSPRVRGVVNEDFDRGMLSSLQTGLSECGGSAEWILWMLVDHPAVRGSTLDALLEAARNTEAPIVIPRRGGRRGHPIMFAKRVAEELLRLPPEASPQDAIRSHYSMAVFVDVNDEGVLQDVDRPEEYRSLVSAERQAGR